MSFVLNRASTAALLYANNDRISPPPPLPSRGEVLNVSWLKAEIIIQVFLSCLLLFSSVCEYLQCHFQVVYFLPGGQGRTCTI